MTTVLCKDKDWFKNEIENAVDGFLDSQRELLCHLLMKYVYEQIFMTACAEHSSAEGTSEATLVIKIPIPDPDTCCELWDGLKPVSFFSEMD